MDKITIPDLNGTNYFIWELKMKAALSLKRLAPLILEEKPEDLTRKDEMDWITKNSDAIAYIKLSLADEQALQFAAEDNAKVLWDKIRATYMGEGEDRKIDAGNELKNIRMKNGETVADYIARARGISTKCHSLGLDVSPRELVYHTVRGLNGKFSKVRDILKTQRGKSMDEILQILREEEATLNLPIKTRMDGINEDIVSKIKNVFEVVENKTNKFLGMEIEKCENGIYLSQCDYINSLLVKHNLENCKSVKTPIVKGEDKIFPSTNEFIDITMYQELIGELLYLANRTRPDISFVISYLSQFNHNPEKRHYNLAKRVLRYLMGSKDKKLFYENEFGILNASSDASWGNAENGKSFSGGVVLLAVDNNSHLEYLVECIMGLYKVPSRKRVRNLDLHFVPAKYRIALYTGTKRIRATNFRPCERGQRDRKQLHIQFS
ncbi:retrovirus-related Pol polyprotein from transposon RE2 [Trichonephila clavipes]|uniref:Retrovirus-related Pol polyprotein from transposon RE2 n=1 Tax=Trichonephila clavipes TaxID=2585209 RepID=A0A8X6VUD1_TRICX|nr:retrovirus-related Pol polyprotein from transposon RE2 [Trichonephila clavipes]